VVAITKQNRKNCLPSVSGVLLRGVQRGTCVVCNEVRVYVCGCADKYVCSWTLLLCLDLVNQYK